MNADEKLLQEYVRVRTTPGHVCVEVRMMEQDGAPEGSLSERWSLAAALPKGASPVQIHRARLITLADHRYFRVCDTCGEKLPAGLVPSLKDGTDECLECSSGAG